jgi:secretion/DNA translocation related TadE-like protein
VSRPDPERGAATVLVVAFLGLLLLVGAALGVVGAMFRAHRAAQSAADLAALSGAAAVARGEDPCAAAARVAEANGATLVSCAPDGFEVRVVAEVDGPRWLGQSADLVGEARAGPVAAASPVTGSRHAGRDLASSVARLARPPTASPLSRPR